jgi:4-hydroxy-2-oxoheptanedioate aldolase
MSRLFERLEKGETMLGTLLLTHGYEWVEIAGEVGLDFVCIDKMFPSIDWDTAGDMVRASSRTGITPMLRLESYPWAGRRDERILADISKALGIGAEGVVVSLDSPEEIEAAVALSGDPHRRVHIYSNYEVPGGVAGLHDLEERLERQTLIMPLVESVGAARRIDEILAVKRLRAVFLGLGDLSRHGIAGVPGNLEHPELREFVARVAARAKQHGVSIFTIAGRQDSQQKLMERVAWLHDAGVTGIFLPNFAFLVQRFYESAVPQVRRIVGAGWS